MDAMQMLTESKNIAFFGNLHIKSVCTLCNVWHLILKHFFRRKRSWHNIQKWRMLIFSFLNRSPSFSPLLFGHCIVCPSSSVLRFTDSDDNFDIFKLPHCVMAYIITMTSVNTSINQLMIWQMTDSYNIYVIFDIIFNKLETTNTIYMQNPSVYKIYTRSAENQNIIPWYYHHGQGGQHDNWFIL